MSSPNLESRVKGCLTGAAIGAELSFARWARPDRFPVSEPGDLLELQLEPVTDYREEPHRVHSRRLTPFIGLGVRAYLSREGRATPEDFAALLENDPDIAGPVFAWDGIHTIQELLKEGMNPRIAGFGNAPCGLVAASMPAVGAYHFADPEYAYLDGVELASVAQPRLGADWAALCAAAVAAAFDTEASPESVVATVLKLAHQNNKELFYEINTPARAGEWNLGRSDEEFAKWWFHEGGRLPITPKTNWIGHNPIRFVLPLLRKYANAPEKLMNLLIGVSPGPWMAWMVGGHSISAIIGGAVIGALHGLDVFPAKWRTWAEPIAAPWFGLLDVIGKRQKDERTIIQIVEKLAQKRDDGTPLLEDKISGCILAGAIGNAMGSPVEGRLYWEIDKEHPDGIQTVLDPRRLEGEDDNQMAMLLVETYIERDGLPVMARHFGKTWRERLNRDHFYPLCMGNAYDLICAGWDPRIVGHWSVVTGSTVMCMEPVGIYHLADPEYARIDATAISYMYQRGLDVVTAAILAATVAEALRPDATVESVCKMALEVAPTQKLVTFDRRPFKSVREYIETCLEIADRYDDVLAARKELYEKCLLYSAIDPLELWGLSLAMFKIARGDVRQAAIGGTNIGRDSDTIAGRAAMLAGTLNGAKSVPEDWTKLFKPEALERIRRNAARLAELVAARKLARLRRRQQ